MQYIEKLFTAALVVVILGFCFGSETEEVKGFITGATIGPGNNACSEKVHVQKNRCSNIGCNCGAKRDSEIPERIVIYQPCCAKLFCQGLGPAQEANGKFNTSYYKGICLPSLDDSSN